MTILKPRTRAISVRLSEEEYAAFRQLSFALGARSVSDLARDAMDVFLRNAVSRANHGSPIVDVHALMKSLDEKIENLAAEFSSFKSRTGN